MYLITVTDIPPYIYIYLYPAMPKMKASDKILFKNSGPHSSFSHLGNLDFYKINRDWGAIGFSHVASSIT